MLRPTQPKTPSPVAEEDAMAAPLGPIRLLKDTVILPAPLEAASRITLNATTSLRAPKIEIFDPSQTELVTLVPWLARSSSRVTLSSPSLAQIAVMPWT